MSRWRLKLEDFGRRQDTVERSGVHEAWHQPRWQSLASNGRDGKAIDDRPMTPSTRCPSSARSAAATPRPGQVSSRCTSPVFTAAGSLTGGKLDTSKITSRYDAGPKPEIEDVPEMYALKQGEQSRDGTLLPPYQLWITLRGGNGSWRQARAREDWVRQCLEHAESEKARQEEEHRLRVRRAEQARIRRQEEEELRRRVEEAEVERRRRAEEQARLQALKDEEMRRRQIEEEQARILRLPRKCPDCRGSGRCPFCRGDGCRDALYLTSYLGNDRIPPIAQGRMPRGCKDCDGCGDSSSGDLVPGTGKCNRCKGAGKVAAPLGGWPTMDDQLASPDDNNLSEHPEPSSYFGQFTSP
eukprot:TRINITY_DN67414_c0_g1_i1.p1 TRINITY_DN67414_c0_g1~~TRINITY_DN67414_c0_g1_i1.p1  ORF type:complete len:377 (-),score=50.45 TRINITY_DN67414_c0_g1_i1:221-1285(-)